MFFKSSTLTRSCFALDTSSYSSCAAITRGWLISSAIAHSSSMLVSTTRGRLQLRWGSLSRANSFPGAMAQRVPYEATPISGWSDTHAYVLVQVNFIACLIPCFQACCAYGVGWPGSKPRRFRRRTGDLRWRVTTRLYELNKCKTMKQL